MHIHLVEFQLEDRQAIDFPMTGVPRDFLTGPPELPSPQESGWKDTFVAPPGKVTRVKIRFAPQYTKDSDLVPGFNPFPFDATAGPGYVWHCHILDHEDNDMMRPMKLRPPAPALARRDDRPASTAARRVAATPPPAQSRDHEWTHQHH